MQFFAGYVDAVIYEQPLDIVCGQITSVCSINGLEGIMHAEVRSTSKALAQQLRGFLNAKMGAECLEQNGAGVLREVVETAVSVLKVVSLPFSQDLLRKGIFGSESLAEI